MIRVQCPSCQRPLQAPDTAGGRACVCPHCHAQVPVPDVAINLDEEIPANTGGPGVPTIVCPYARPRRTVGRPPQYVMLTLFAVLMLAAGIFIMGAVVYLAARDALRGPLEGMHIEALCLGFALLFWCALVATAAIALRDIAVNTWLSAHRE